MSRTRFQSESTLYSCLNGAKSEGEVTATGLEPRTTEFLNEHSTIWLNWLSVRLRTQWFWVRVQLQSIHSMDNVPVQPSSSYENRVPQQQPQSGTYAAVLQEF